MRNDGGETLLHKAISGMCGPGFRELNSGIKLLEKLCGGGVVDIKGMINIRNDEGGLRFTWPSRGTSTPDSWRFLHSVPGIDVNIRTGGTGRPRWIC
ncbi:hypothetical protein MLD38_001063 [Melastoma candidum]|uniref:Uncharacterized protein n=1 Tax=Melastoma candidum TaxID=119954 RepID=A0ACB9SCZ7_9MYRT|nr:hypothetical protein MLD38_001063 [Melastoma candidum]